MPKPILKFKDKSSVLSSCFLALYILSLANLTVLFQILLQYNFDFILPVNGIGVIHPSTATSFLWLEMFFQFSILLGAWLYFIGGYKKTARELKVSRFHMKLFKVLLVITSLVLGYMTIRNIFFNGYLG